MKRKKITIVGIAHITSTFNNTIIAISDARGSIVAWTSSGSKGFKGKRKATPYAAQIAAESTAKKAQELGIKTVSVNIQGPGNGRDSAIRALINSGLNITAIRDVTSIPHNGCRPPKRRRV